MHLKIVALVLTLLPLYLCCQTDEAFQKGDYVRYKNKAWYKLYEVEEITKDYAIVNYSDEGIRVQIDSFEKVESIEAGSILYHGWHVLKEGERYDWFKVEEDIFPPFNYFKVKGRWVKINPEEEIAFYDEKEDIVIKKIVDGPIDSFMNQFFHHKTPGSWMFSRVYSGQSVSVRKGDLVKRKSSSSDERYDIYKVTEIESNGNVLVEDFDFELIQTLRFKPKDIEKVHYLSKESKIITSGSVLPGHGGSSIDEERFILLEEDWDLTQDSVLCSLGYTQEEYGNVINAQYVKIRIRKPNFTYLKAIIPPHKKTKEEEIISSKWYYSDDNGDQIVFIVKNEERSYCIDFRADGFYYLNSLVYQKQGYQDQRIKKYMGRWIVEDEILILNKGKMDEKKFEIDSNTLSLKME